MFIYFCDFGCLLCFSWGALLVFVVRGVILVEVGLLWFWMLVGCNLFILFID